MRRLVGSLLLLLLVMVSWAQAANTHGRPDEAGERQAWWGDAFTPYIVSGCLPTVPSSSLTFAAFACTGYVRGALTDLVYVVQSAVSLTLTNVNGLHWVAIHRDTSTGVGGWTRRAGSHYLFQQAATQPATPSAAVIVARVTVVASVITKVESIANPGPVLSTAVSSGKNVKECGAKVDGVTDDTVALNTCLATYPHVFVPAGILKHSGKIILNYGNRLSGVGPGLIDVAGSGSPGPRVQGSTLRYTGTGDAMGNTDTATVATCQCIIENLLIRSTTGAVGIHLDNVADVWIDRVIINGQDDAGVTPTGFISAGIWLDGGGGGADPAMITTRITNSQIVETEGHGILANGVNNTNVINIFNTRIHGNAGDGILTQVRCRGWNIVGGDIEGNAGYGIRVSEKGEGWFINTYLEGNGAAAQIWLRMCAGCRVTGSVIQGNGSGSSDAAIKLGDAASGLIPQGVTIDNNTFQGVAKGVNVEAAWGVKIDHNMRGVDVPLEIGGPHTNVQQLDYQGGTILNDASPGVTLIETIPVIQGQVTTPLQIGNTAAETTLYTTVIRANAMASPAGAGGVELNASGSFLNNTGVDQTVTLRVKYGAAVVGQLQWAALPSGTVRGWVLQGVLTASPGFGAGRMICVWHGSMGPVGSASGTPTAVVSSPALPLVQTCNPSDTTTVDMTVNQNLIVTGQLSAADANLAVAMERAYVKRLPY